MERKSSGIFCSVAVLVFMFMAVAMPSQVKAASVTANYPGAKIYKVTAYGADKTGKKKSDTAINAAVKAARKDAAKKKVIYFPSGKYSVSSPIRLYDGMILAAEKDSVITGTGEKIINVHDTTGTRIEGGVWKGGKNTTVFSSNMVSRLTIKNMKITSGFVGMKIGGGSAIINNVYVTGCKSVGITCTHKTRTTVQNSQITGNGSGYPNNGLGHGVGVYKSSYFTAVNCRVNNNRECGVSANQGNINMKNCVLQSNGRQGIGTHDKCSVVMTGCDIYKNGYKDNMNGVIVVDGSKGTFTNCKFRSNAVTGLLITDGGTNVTVKGCTFTGNRSHNIYGENKGAGKAAVTISGSSFFKCPGGDSIRIQATSKSAFSISLKSGNKFKNVSRYVYQIGNRQYVTK